MTNININLFPKNLFKKFKVTNILNKFIPLKSLNKLKQAFSERNIAFFFLGLDLDSPNQAKGQEPHPLQEDTIN